MRSFKAKPCADCKRRYPFMCMDFDHVRGRKKFVVGYMHLHNRTVVEREIAKCDVVCANCHRIRTWTRRKK